MSKADLNEPPTGVITANLMLGRWSFADSARLEPLLSGLINRSFAVVVDDQPTAVLQWLNPAVVPTDTNHDIVTVGECLQKHGVSSPRILPSLDGHLWVTDDLGGIWRCLSYVGNRTVERYPTAADVHSAGALVARFHRALDHLETPLRCPRAGAQDTEHHLSNLDVALQEHRGHRLHEQVSRLSESIHRTWDRWAGPRNLPPRLIHGDLKISNIRFQDSDAIALVDLDTLAVSTIDAELGDALRSWCNRAGEDDREALFDLEIFSAAMSGYAEGGGRAFLSSDEWSSIAPGAERITLNLSARFAADALNERYFGWNPRYGGRGEHNLLRARGQISLCAAMASMRHRTDEIMGRITARRM